MQALGQFKDRKIDCIAKNMENYITFSIGKLQFLDSYQFMTASLHDLISNLPKDKFSIMREHFNPNHVDALLRKGVYPYEYMDDFSKFDETKLPAREHFFSSLSGELVSEDEYAFANEVWQTLQLKTLGDYHDVYLIADVLLLGDVFQNFRSLCLEFYQIDPCHLLTAPGLAWQSFLKMSKVKLELIQDPNMYLFLEQEIRGMVGWLVVWGLMAQEPFLAKLRQTYG
ncbi:hypothetical protein AVEN_266027-1 [Araneus ventricosus]|uniref:DNA-directed DNA polymerase n=1 Tax=Araneus ventricosus TaxID=182803 RepID=A0A4Y2S7G1_ARAVE|nr:hypothetical protein AVEN_266027-1 [Araneus ventricosus]